MSGLNVICDCSANELMSVSDSDESVLIYMSIERRADPDIPAIVFVDSDYRTRIIREPSTMKGVHINRKHSLMIPRINRMNSMKPADI